MPGSSLRQASWLHLLSVRAAPESSQALSGCNKCARGLHLLLTKAGLAGAEQQQPAAVQQLTRNAARQADCTHQLIILSN